MGTWDIVSEKPIILPRSEPIRQHGASGKWEEPIKPITSKVGPWDVVKETPIGKETPTDNWPASSTPSFSDFVDDVWEGISGIPLGIGGSFASAIEGGDPVEISQIKDWKDGIINSARQRSKKNYEMPGAGSTYVDSAGVKITRQDVRNAWQNLGFSITSMLGSIGAALGTAIVTKNPIATYGAAATAGGVLAGRMDANMIMWELRDGMDKEALAQIGRPLTDDEFVSISKAPEMQSALQEMGVEWNKRGNVGSLVREHAFDEAKWEALGNIVMLKAGKHLFKYAQKAGLLKGLLTFAGGSAGEVLTEGGTQTEQQSAEVRLGLRPGEKERSLTSFEDWKTSGAEVAGPTLLTTGVMGGAAYGAGRIAGAMGTAVPEQREEPPSPVTPSVEPLGPTQTITPGEAAASAEKPPLESLIQDGDIIRHNGKPFSTEKAAILIAKSRKLVGYVPIEVEQDQWVLRKQAQPAEPVQPKQAQPIEPIQPEQAQPVELAQAKQEQPEPTIPESPPAAAVAPTPPIPATAQTAVEGAPIPAAPPRVETVTAPPEAAKPAPISGFTTAKGSRYILHEDGTTSRDKAARPEHPGDSGPKKRSQETFYVDEAGALALSEFQARGQDKKRITKTKDGKIGIQYITGGNAGKFERRTITVARPEPSVGLTPVELWDDGKIVHFGNPITEITPAAPPGAEVDQSENEPQKAAPATIADAKTGVPFNAKLMRGQGRADSPYNKLGLQEPILGRGLYTTDNADYARYFGGSITEHEVNLVNPLVIENDSQWRALTKNAGWEFPNPFMGDKEKAASDIKSLRSQIESTGYDGVIVRVPESEFEGKTLQKVFGASQVIEFHKEKPIAPTAPKEPIGKTQEPIDPITNAAKTQSTYDKYISYLNGRLGRNEVTRDRAKIDQVWEQTHENKQQAGAATTQVENQPIAQAPAMATPALKADQARPATNQAATQVENLPERGEVPRAVPVEPKVGNLDIFGQDTKAEQAISNAKRAKDEKRSGKADVPVTAGEFFGQGGKLEPDLFSQESKASPIPDAVAKMAESVTKLAETVDKLAEKIETKERTQETVESPKAIVNEQKELGKKADKIENASETKEEEAGGAMFSRRLSGEGAFYSQLMKSMRDAPDRVFTTGKATALWLQANAPKLNIKKDELHFSGVLDWLQTQGKVTKADVLGYLKDGGVNVEETSLGGEEENAKFAQYVPPGGKPGTYRELLLELPKTPVREPKKITIGKLRSADKSLADDFEEEIFLYADRRLTPEELDVEVNNVLYPSAHIRVSQDVADRIKALFPEEKASNDAHLLALTSNFLSPHYPDHPNLIAHLRVDEVEGANGERLLRVIEIQSDWGQKGRNEGFNNPEARAEISRLSKEYDVLNAERNKELTAARDTKDEGDIFVGHIDRAAEIKKQLNVLQAKMDTLRSESKSTIPAAPFVTDTGAWLSLSIKKAISYAAENGMDGIVFATGQQNADLYDLSKQVKEIVYAKSDDGKTVMVDAFRTDGGELLHRKVFLEELPDVVGKEVAQKISDGPRTGKLSGLDLKVGGEGQLKFYGTPQTFERDITSKQPPIVPIAVNKALKQVGADTKATTLDLAEIPESKKKNGKAEWEKTLIGFIIPDGLRAKAINGLPLFSVKKPTATAALSQDAVTDIVTRLRRSLGLGGDMKITVHQSEDALFSSIPEIAEVAKKQNAEGQISAVHHKGEIHLVASKFNTEAEVEEAILHEAYGHYGANRLFGKDFSYAMKKLYIKLGGRAGVRSIAEKYGIDLGPYLKTAKDFKNDEWSAVYLADELLAHMQGKKAYETIPQRITRAVKEFVGAIRNTLRKKGFAELSKVSDADITYLLRKMGDAAKASGEPGDTRFMRDRRLDDNSGRRKNTITERRIDEYTRAWDVRDQNGRLISMARTFEEAVTTAESYDEPRSDVMFQRKTPIGLQHNEPLLKQAGEFVQDFTKASKLNIWHRTIGTQQHKAKVFPETFGPVFKEVDAFTRDTSRIANESADLADDLLIRIESFKDLIKAKPSKKSIQKLAAALYEGTLAGGGSPMKGVIWGDDYLKRYFKMNDKEISFYRQSLNAAANSNDELAKSIIYKYTRKLPVSFDRGMVLEDIYASVNDQLNTLADGYQMAIETLPEGDENIEEFQKKLNDIRARQDTIADVVGIAQKLRESGYFPLKRFGRYAISVYEGKNIKFFGMYESKIAFAFAKNRVKKEYPGGEIRTNTVSKESYKLYQGMSLDVVEAFAEHLDIGSDPVIQEFLRAALAERNILKHRIHRKGILGQSQDIPRSLGAYILSASRSASSAYHLANMIELADKIEEGEIKDDATNLVKFIQVPIEEAHKLRAFLFYNFIGGSIAHGAIQLTQPIMTTAPFLVQYTSYSNAIAELAKAANDYRKVGKLTGKLASDYARAAEEGVISPQEIHQLRADAEKSFLGGSTTVRKLVFAWGSIYSITEQMNRSITFLAAYRIGEKMGATKLKETGFDNVYDFAKDTVDQTQFIYSKASRPNLFRGKVGATVGTFKQFSISYLELFTRLYKADKKAAAIMATTLFFMAGLSGLPFKDDVEDLIDTIGQWMGHGTNSKKAVREWAEKEIGEVGYDIVSKGISGIPGFPIDTSARLGFPNLLPGSAALMPAEKNKQREVVEVLGPAGQLLPIEGTQIGNMLERLAKGDLFGAAKSGLPVALQNYLKGYEMMKTGEYRDSRGIPVMPVTKKEGATKFIGFQPARVKKQVEIEMEAMQDKAMHDLVESSVADKWAKGMFYDNQELQDEATKELQEWNEKNPDIPVVITSQQLKQRIKDLSQTRAQRITSRAPKEMRGKIGESVQRD